jgi:hypothetical protein
LDIHPASILIFSVSAAGASQQGVSILWLGREAEIFALLNSSTKLAANPAI